MPRVKPFAALLSPLLFSCFFLVGPADGDSLTFHFNGATEQSVTVGSSLTQVSFNGFITNGSLSPITFALITPSPGSPYVASVVSPFSFPGITLPAGESTAAQTLALVTFNLFDPSLPYPGLANIVLEAETLQGEIIAETGLTVHILSATAPEPPVRMLLAFSCLGLLALLAARTRVCHAPRRVSRFSGG
jgi:hypothetical protein